MEFIPYYMRKTISSETITRRKALSAIGGGMAIGLAGCMQGEPPTEEDYMISDVSSPQLGDGDTIVEVYVDFMCPQCADWHQDEYQQLVDEYIDTGEVTLIHRDFPIPVHDDLSYEIASAARFVYDEAGDEDFWEFSGCVLENQDSINNLQNVEDCATEEVDAETMLSAGERNLYLPAVMEDRNNGEADGVTGTPTVSVDGEYLDEPWGDTLFPALE